MCIQNIYTINVYTQHVHHTYTRCTALMYIPHVQHIQMYTSCTPLHIFVIQKIQNNSILPIISTYILVLLLQT